MQQNQGIAIGLVLLAVVVGCVSEPAKQPAAESSATTSLSEAVVTSESGQPAQSIRTIAASKESTTAVEPSVATISNPGSAANVDEEIIVGGKKLSIPNITGSVSPRDDRYHDTDNNAIVVLQSPTKAMAEFPRDRRNEVDWVKTLDQGHIEPRADLRGESQMVTMDMDIIMKNTQFMPWVRFPHIAHTKWLACENCHPKIFLPKENANPISMNKVLRGEYCGVCHDKVAFSLFICERCHSVPHEGSGPAWWKNGAS
jgi:c(7)-type cytochrome triheme protein